MTKAAPRIVVVTGAAAGIGLATAKAFADAGDTVVLTDVDLPAVEEQAATLGDPHVGLAMNVADEPAVVACIAAVARRFGRIDVLVNNAGIVDPHAVIVFDKPIDQVRRMIAVNLEGTFVAAREAGQIMLQQGSGAIVNLSSGAALAALPGRTPYSMTKAAILGLTRALARDWAGGIRVNAVLPGYVRTEILASLERAGKFDSRAAGTTIPIGRVAEPEEIAEVIRHVAGAHYVTGIGFLADGGYAAFGARAAASSSPVSGRVPIGIVVVAGGESSTSSAIADHFVALGRTVVVVDKDPARIAALATDRLGVLLDLQNETAVENAIHQIVSTHGPIAILVNAPGANDVPDPDAGQPLDSFRDVFAADLIGPLTLSRSVAKAMAKAGAGGAIVNVLPSAVIGKQLSPAHQAAKTAVTMLTKSLACEWAEHGIRLNTVAHGRVAAKETPEPANQPTTIPMGRFAAPSEIAHAVGFLASSASSYVTGMCYTVDGGLSALDHGVNGI